MDTYAVQDASGETRAVVAPERGAIVTSLTMAGRELLYMDRGTLDDGAKNVRGGIPVLFPSPGKLKDDQWQRGGRSGQMKQHGFARTLPWRVDAARSRADSLYLTFKSSAATRAQYPWDFEAGLQYAVVEGALTITARIKNLSADAMPYALGFHPYFLVPDKLAARIDTRARQAFNNVSKQVEPFAGFDWSQSELDLHLLDHGSASAALELGRSRITVRASAEFSLWVVWSLAEKPFVCLEPWTSLGNALNTGDRLLEIEAGEEHASWIEIACSEA